MAFDIDKGQWVSEECLILANLSFDLDFEASLEQSVAENLTTDSKVGLSWSGGIDSTALLVAATTYVDRIRTYSVKPGVIVVQGLVKDVLLISSKIDSLGS